MVLLTMVTTESLNLTPQPSELVPVTWFSETVLLVSLKVPVESKRMPPPLCVVGLP
jgi:hypothetical protein